MANKRFIHTPKRYLIDKKLVQTTQEWGIDPDDIFSDLDIKYELIEAYGYKSLRGAESLSSVEDPQLGVAFRRIHEAALENIVQFEAEQEAERLNRVPRKLTNPFFDSALRRFQLKHGRKPENYSEWESVVESVMVLKVEDKLDNYLYIKIPLNFVA